MTPLDIARLSPQERLDLIGRLWDSLDAADVPLTPNQTAELDRRLASFEDDVKQAISWEEFETELTQRYG